MKIAFLGDIGVFETGLLGRDWKSELSQIHNELKAYDLVIANLEAPITEKNRTLVCKGIHLKTSKEIIEVLKYLNVSAVSLANNHICDFGLKGMMDTIAELDTAGIGYYGVNNKTWEYINNETRIRFSGFCCYSTNGAYYSCKNRKNGVNALDTLMVKRQLEADKLEGFYSVLSLHWGDEYSHYPNSIQVKWVHSLIKDYDFILHGHHAHVIQGIEKINNSVIAYNQGNFCFDDCFSTINPKIRIRQSEENKVSFVLGVTLVNKIIIDLTTIGIKYSAIGISLLDNRDIINRLSDEIVNCDTPEYKNKSCAMIKNLTIGNRGKHDLKWLLSKLNYYSIGAFLTARLHKKKYLNAYKRI